MTKTVRISGYLDFAHLWHQTGILKTQNQHEQEVRERLGKRSPSGKNITLARVDQEFKSYLGEVTSQSLVLSFPIRMSTSWSHCNGPDQIVTSTVRNTN